jgi:hypothetical protein
VRGGYGRVWIVGGRWSWWRTIGKHRHGRALYSNRPCVWDSSLPWGEARLSAGLRKGRSRRSDTPRRRRSPRYTIAGNTRYIGFSVKYVRTQHMAPRSMSSNSPFPSWYPPIDRSASGSSPMVIATAHSLERRPASNVNHRGGYRRIHRIGDMLENRRRRTGERRKYPAAMGERAPTGRRMLLCISFPSSPPKGKGSLC